MDAFAYQPAPLNAEQDRPGQKIWEGGLPKRLRWSAAAANLPLEVKNTPKGQEIRETPG
jgi:hypothetical protein